MIYFSNCTKVFTKESNMNENVVVKRIVIITGGGRGIGFEVAQRFASNGDIVILFDSNENAGESAAMRIREKNLQAVFRCVDVAGSESVRDSIKWVMQQYGGIDILVNCAGILDTGSIEDLEESTWDNVLNVNLKGTYLVTQAAIPCMKDRGNGRIINISSLAGRMGGRKTGPAYSASKAGMIGLTKAVARMVAHYGITVNAVAPGTTNTEMVTQFSRDELDQLIAGIPLGRLIEPDEIAEAVFFLASDKSGMITGAVLDINGGVYMA
jgi:NAD(P)-dependent dehydrogenase (short-subunit alcohol dehydrogenase family)